MSRRDLVLQTLASRRNELRQFSVRRLSLFGSAARGDGGPASDLDFVVDFETKSFDAYMDTRRFLEKLFDAPVDLVLSDAIKLPALEEAVRDLLARP